MGNNRNFVRDETLVRLEKSNIEPFLRFDRAKKRHLLFRLCRTNPLVNSSDELSVREFRLDLYGQIGGSSQPAACIKKGNTKIWASNRGLIRGENITVNLRCRVHECPDKLANGHKMPAETCYMDHETEPLYRQTIENYNFLMNMTNPLNKSGIFVPFPVDHHAVGKSCVFFLSPSNERASSDAFDLDTKTRHDKTTSQTTFGVFGF